MPAHLHSADRFQVAVVADRGGVHLTRQAVDPQQLGSVSVPPRPLGGQPAAGRAAPRDRAPSALLRRRRCQWS
jgi:hypothetical protein